MKTFTPEQTEQLNALALAHAQETIDEVAPEHKDAAYEAVMSDFLAGACAAGSILTEDAMAKLKRSYDWTNVIVWLISIPLGALVMGALLVYAFMIWP